VGQVISELVLDGASSSFDLRPLRARRFMEGELFGGEGSKNVMGATIGG